MIILVKLILAHLMGDFVLQSRLWVMHKEAHKITSYKLYLHGLLHGVLVLLVLWNIDYWRLAVAVAVIHTLIDILKLYAQKENNRTRWFIIDQILHIISIVTLWVIFVNPDINITKLLNSDILWLYTTAVLFLTVVCGIIMQIILAKWEEEEVIRKHKEKSLVNAGKYIGILERLLVFTFVICGHWEAIGFLVAAKSVFRYGDIKEAENRKLTEYILIGTLLSFSIAIATGGIVTEFL